MISLCFLVPVITEIIGLRWGGGCRWDKMNDLDCLDFSSSHCSSIPSMGTMWKMNKNKQEQRRDSQSRRRSPSPTSWSENTSGLEPQRPLQLRALWLCPEGRRFPRGRPGSDSGYVITVKARLSRGSRPQQFTSQPGNPLLLKPVWSVTCLSGGEQRRESLSPSTTKPHVVKISGNCGVNIFVGFFFAFVAYY